jgi:hypothetical protein
VGPRASEWLGAALLLAVLVALCAVLVLLAASDEATALVTTLVA